MVQAKRHLQSPLEASFMEKKVMQRPCFALAVLLGSIASSMLVVGTANSQSLAVAVIELPGPSVSGDFLEDSAIGVALVAMLLPYIPLAPDLGLAPLSWPVMLALAAITAGYVGVTEAAKSRFYHRNQRASGVAEPGPSSIVVDAL